MSDNILDSVLSYIADNICIEEGDSGIWHYKKYANNTIECWGKYTESEQVAFSATGNIYYRTISGIPDYPFTFNSNPFIIASLAFGNTGGCTVGTTTTKPSVTVSSAVASARNCTIYIYARGQLA